jgi:hypothetical protein
MNKRALVLAMVAGFSVFAVASRPSSIVGTWRGVADQTTVSLVITTQGTTGTCKQITGTLNNVSGGGESNIQGFYCPGTGRVSFVRKDVGNNETFQSYSGNVSDTGTTLRMAGVFAELSEVRQLGEYNFAVSEKAP